MRSYLFTLAFFFSSLSFGQANTYQNLIDTVLSRNRALFISSEPLKVFRLDQNGMLMYFENLRDWSKQQLDTVMFSQIIQNSKKIDTSLWKENEFPFSLLVNSRNENIPKKYALQKLALSDKRKIKFYKKQINKFNTTEAYDRNLYYFSKPVFDNSKTFAIVQRENGHSGLGGGGGIVLFQFQNAAWREIGIIMNWRY